MRVERRRVIVVRAPIPACGVGLPHFDQRARHGTTLLVQQTTRHDDALALRLRGVPAREIVVTLTDSRTSESFAQ